MMCVFFCRADSFVEHLLALINMTYKFKTRAYVDKFN